MNEEQTTQENKLQETLQNKENHSKVVKLCNYLESTFNGNWFTVEKMVKKTQFSKEEARDVLLTINMFGYLAEINKKGVIEYKVVHTNEAKLSVLRLDKQLLEERLKEVESEIKEFEEKLNERNK